VNFGKPYKRVRGNNLNMLHIMASGSTWRKIRGLTRGLRGLFIGDICYQLQEIVKHIPLISLSFTHNS